MKAQLVLLLCIFEKIDFLVWLILGETQKASKFNCECEYRNLILKMASNEAPLGKFFLLVF
jgi:hypothetical protein